jgi:tetratricopeptide (TPR) repeat protein
MNFGDEITRGAQLFESGQLAEAAAVFRQLCEDPSVPTKGRAIAAFNLATTYDKMGHTDHAVATHEYAVGIVTDDYLFAQEGRAAYLHKIGRLDDAIALWDRLLDLEFVEARRADAYRNNVEVARAQRSR